MTIGISIIITTSYFVDLCNQTIDDLNYYLNTHKGPLSLAEPRPWSVLVTTKYDVSQNASDVVFLARPLPINNILIGSNIKNT